MPSQQLMGVTIKASRDVKAEVRKLDLMAASKIRNSIRKELRQATRETRITLRNQVRESLPKKGGLNTWAARMPTVSATIQGRNQGIRIKLTRRGADMRALNRGRIRHPVFAKKNRKRTWVNQAGPAGWWETAIKKDAPRLRREIQTGLNRAITKTWEEGS